MPADHIASIALQSGLHVGTARTPPVHQRRSGPWNTYVKWGISTSGQVFGTVRTYEDITVLAHDRVRWKAAAEAVAHLQQRSWQPVHTTLFQSWRAPLLIDLPWVRYVYVARTTSAFSFLWVDRVHGAQSYSGDGQLLSSCESFCGIIKLQPSAPFTLVLLASCDDIEEYLPGIPAFITDEIARRASKGEMGQVVNMIGHKQLAVQLRKDGRHVLLGRGQVQLQASEPCLQPLVHQRQPVDRMSAGLIRQLRGVQEQTAEKALSRRQEREMFTAPSAKARARSAPSCFPTW
eukprot:s3445_g2.t1